MSSVEHSRDAVGYGRSVPTLPWPNGSKLAVSVVVHFQEGAERSPAEGDEGPESDVGGLTVEGTARDLFTESMYEYGVRRGGWRVLDVLAKHGVRATYFACGLAIERSRELTHAIEAQGHELAGHGYRWLPYTLLTEAQQREDIERCIRTFESVLGRPPRGWMSRVPSPSTRRLLAETQVVEYDSDTYDDDLPHYADAGESRFLTIPYTLDVTDSKYWVIPQMAGYRRTDDFSQVAIAAFDQLHAEASAGKTKLLSIGVHQRISGLPSFIQALDDFLFHAKRHADVCWMTRAEISDHWRENYPIEPAPELVSAITEGGNDD